MEQKTSFSKFTDRDLLEIILLNQLHIEKKLERMEMHFEKSYKNVSEYINAPHEKDGRQDGYSSAKTFEELLGKASSAKSDINQLLKRKDSEINW